MRLVDPTARAKASISAADSPVIADGPFRRPRLEVHLELARNVGVLLEVVPIGIAVAEEDVHHRAGERGIGAGLEAERDVGLLHGLVAVDVDDRDPRAPLLPRPHRMGHDVDLGRDRIGAPDHDEVGLRHLARVGSGEPAHAGAKTRIGRSGADGVVLTRVAAGVPEAMDAVPLHQPHCAGVVVRPDRLRSVPRHGLGEGLGDEVERIVPADPLPAVAAPVRIALFAFAAKRMEQAVRVMDALGVTRHLGADHARRVVVGLRPTHPAHGDAVDDLHLEGAGRGAVMRTGGMADLGR